ncbi:MAG: hypothetical protein D6765_12105 [Bacteroidetes bacterium]|nr:MAG: hypothetical protein D6765_12105 [Bacteroidota bacterium]
MTDWQFWTELIAGKILLPLILFWLGYRFGIRRWLREKKEERRLKREEMQYHHRLESLRAVWGLLAYMSQKENEKTVFVKRLKKQSGPEGGSSAAWFLRTKQAHDFLERLPRIFYEQGHGILLPDEIRRDLFAFRTHIHRLLDSARQGREKPLPERIEVLNEKLPQTLNQIYDRLLLNLRKELASKPETN